MAAPTRLAPGLPVAPANYGAVLHPRSEFRGHDALRRSYDGDRARVPGTRRQGLGYVVDSNPDGTVSVTFLHAPATKPAIRSFARNWITELKDRRIRVNVVSPRAVNTPGLSDASGDQASLINGADIRADGGWAQI